MLWVLNRKHNDYIVQISYSVSSVVCSREHVPKLIHGLNSNDETKKLIENEKHEQTS